MKKILLLFFAALCIIIASCSKDSGFGPGSDSSVAMSKGYPAHGPVIVVPPNKDGENDDDTDDLLAAINSAEPGTIIKLTEGEYHVGYMEILGFNGTLMGAGRNKTIINVAGLIDQFGQYYDYNLMPCWLRIIGGDVVISDLAFKTGDGVLVKEPFTIPGLYDYESTLISLVVVNNYSDQYGKGDPQPMDFTIKNVDFLCGTLDPDLSYYGAGYNVLMAIWVGFPYWDPPADGYVLTKGNYNVKNCYFETTYQGFEALGLGEEAVCNVNQTKTNDVLFGMFCSGNFGPKINFTDNTFVNSKWFDLFIDDNDWGLVMGDEYYNRSEYFVSGNKFYSLPGVSSLIFQDTRQLMFTDYFHNPTLAVIKNNYFSLSEGCTGISLFSNTDGQIRNNRLTGKADAGIRIDGLTWFLYENPPAIYPGGLSKNALILGNNFTGLEATYDIWFGPNSMDCTVVGNGKDSVLDEGTGNKIVGMKMKSGGGHVGPTIRDNFQMWQSGRHH